MAGLVLIPLEIGAEWLLAALGITAVGTTAVVLSRTGSKDETDAPAIPDTATRTRTRTCKQCPPDCGSLVTRNWNMSDVSRDIRRESRALRPAPSGASQATISMGSALDCVSWKRLKPSTISFLMMIQGSRRCSGGLSGSQR
jgi:hypothetical protein